MFARVVLGFVNNVARAWVYNPAPGGPLAAFPLPLKLRKLKLRNENTLNGNASISQKCHKKVFYAHIRWFFMQFEKGIFR